MAIIYSLICFGGRTGKTVTFTVSGSVVNLTNHGLRDGKGVAFSSTGTLPAGLAAGTIYYVRSTGANTFTLHATNADALANTGQVTFTTTGTGTHNVKGQYFLSLTSGQRARYGSPGSERIYDGLVSMLSGTNPQLTINDEAVIEFGDEFDDTIAYAQSMNTPASRTAYTSLINGERSSAFHFGVVGRGYTLRAVNDYANGPNVTGFNTTVDGISFRVERFTVRGFELNGNNNVLKNCIAFGVGSPGSSVGFLINDGAINCALINNLAVGISGASSTGFRFNGYGANLTFVAHNSAHKNTNGFQMANQSTTQRGFYYNNVSVGNTVNWSAFNSTQFQAAANNYGEAADQPWFKGTDTSIKTLTTDHFADWAANDFRPAPGAPHVDTAINTFRMEPVDLSGFARPAYNDGNPEVYDGGCYERDLGFVRPAAHTLTLTNVVVGSRVLIESQDGSTAHYSGVASTTTVTATVTVYGDARDQWRIKVRKASESPFYIPWETLTNVTAGESSIYVSQIPDE